MPEERVVEVTFRFQTPHDVQARAFEKRALYAGLHWDTFAFDRSGQEWQGTFRIGEGLFSVDGPELVRWLRSQAGVENLKINPPAV